MGKLKNHEFEREARPEDELANGYFELQRSTEYGDERKFSLEHLQALGHYWAEQCDNPLRSQRGQEEARLITRRITFECAVRTGRTAVLMAYYNPNTEKTSL